MENNNRLLKERHLPDYLAILLILILNLVIFRKLFLTSGLAIYVDTAPFNLNMNSLHTFANYLWVDRYSATGLSTLPIYIMNFFALEKIYSIINFFIQNKEINNILWVFLPYPAFGITIYYFIKNFVKNNYLALLGVVSYTLSFVYFDWFVGSGSNILVWSLVGTIGFCLAFIRILNQDKISEKIKYALLGSLASLLAIANIAYFYVFMIFLMIYFFSSMFGNSKPAIKKQFINAIIFGATTLFVNLFWIIPIKFMGNGSTISYGNGNDNTLAVNSACASYIRNLMYLYCWVRPRQIPIYAILMILLLLTITYFIITKRNKTNIILLGSFSLFYLISLGLNSPFWKPLQLLPGSFLFRVPQRVYTVMLLIFVILILRIIENYRSKITYILFSALIIFSAYYFIGHDRLSVFPKVNIPNEYQAVSNLLQKTENINYRTTIFPKMGWLVRYNWAASYTTPPVIDFYLNNRILWYWLRGDNTPEVLKPIFENASFDNPDYNIPKILGFYNSKFILYSNDIQEIAGATTFEPSFKKVSAQNNLSQVFESNSLNVFEIKNSYILPTIYLPNKAIPTIKENILKTLSAEPETRLVLIDKNSDFNFLENNGGIEFKKINPSEYSLGLKNVSASSVFVFQEEYNPSWKLYSENRVIGQSNYEHLKVNEFANGYKLDVKKVCKEVKCEVNNDGTYSLNLKLKYWPQTIFNYLLTFTYVLFASGIVAFILISNINRLKKTIKRN